MRSFCIATINNELNAAMTSRFDVIQTFQEPKNQTGRKKIEKASTSPESVAIQAANLQFQYAHTAYAKFFASMALGGWGDICFRSFELFCSLYTEVLVKRGRASMMARDVDKLRNLSLGVMVDRVTGAWERTPRYAHVVDNVDAFLRYFQINGGAVTFKDIIKANYMAKPTNSGTAMDELVLRVIKKNIVIGVSTVEAATDDTGTYFATTLVRKDIEKEMTDSAHSMGEDCSVDMMGRAFAKLSEKSILSSKCVKYCPLQGSTDPKNVLHIKCEMVSTTACLTDSEIKVLEWIREVTAGDMDVNGFNIWSTDFRTEEHYLLHKHLKRGLLEPAPMSNTPCDPLLDRLKEILDTPQRQTAMFWLLKMTTPDGTSVFEQTDSTAPFTRMRLCDTRTTLSVPCHPTGRNAGKFKEELGMPGSIRVNIDALMNYEEGKAKQAADAQLYFCDLVMAIGGENKPGDKIFITLSDVIDETTPAAVCHTLRKCTDSVTIPNPRRLEASVVLDHAAIQEVDDILTESKSTITLDHDSDITQKILDAACRSNTSMSYEQAMIAFDKRFSNDQDSDDAISVLSSLK